MAFKHCCPHKVVNPKVCGNCLSVSYCGDACAAKDWTMNHQFECLQQQQKRRREPTDEELLQWAEENPSGWDHGTTPRRWPEEWIYDPEYFGDDFWKNFYEEEEEEEEAEFPQTVIVPSSVKKEENRQRRKQVDGPTRRKLIY